MDKSGKYVNRLSSVMMSCDYFTTGFAVMFILFLLPYVFESGLMLAAAFLPIACILPFAVMPLLYSLVHRFDPLLFGRYHLFMPLSGFLAALMFVFLWSCDTVYGGAGLFFFSALLILFTSFYRYCSFSVRARLAGDNVAKPTAATRAFSIAGGVTAIGLVYGFYRYEKSTAMLNAAYIVAAVAVIFVIAQYLFTFYGIPKLGGKRVQSIKSVFRAFYGDISKRTFFSALFFTAAFLTLAFAIVGFATVTGAPYMPIACAAIVAAVFMGVDFAVTKKAKRRNRVFSLVDILCIVAAAALLISVLFLKTPQSACSVFLALSAAIIGGGGAVAFRQTGLRMLTIKPRVTSGIVFILIALVLLAAAAIAIAVNVSVFAAYGATGKALVFVYLFGGAVVLGVIGFIAARKRYVKGENIPELSYELNTEEIRRAGGEDSRDGQIDVAGEDPADEV